MSSSTGSTPSWPSHGSRTLMAGRPRLPQGRWSHARRTAPEKLVNALLAERPFEQSKLHLACVDGCHGRVPEPADAQRRLQLRLRPGFCPQPPHIFFLYLSANFRRTSKYEFLPAAPVSRMCGSTATMHSWCSSHALLATSSLTISSSSGAGRCRRTDPGPGTLCRTSSSHRRSPQETRLSEIS